MVVTNQTPEEVKEALIIAARQSNADQRKLVLANEEADNLMSKDKTVWVLYQFNRTAQYGNSFQFETYEQALNAEHRSSLLETYVLEQTYELEEDSSHDCGDDE